MNGGLVALVYLSHSKQLPTITITYALDNDIQIHNDVIES